uniref:Uncharacterized protein n=1 Tax=Desertifilum tharense IPPAS B-1220 TaxID=1781255 RepID=A0ACD5GYV9_9CYAN
MQSNIKGKTLLNTLKPTQHSALYTQHSFPTRNSVLTRSIPKRDRLIRQEC